MVLEVTVLSNPMELRKTCSFTILRSNQMVIGLFVKVRRLRFRLLRWKTGTKAIKVIPGEKLDVKKSRKKRNGGVCYNCGGVGHLRRNCSSVVKCVKCGVMGHNVRECPMKTGQVVSFYGRSGYGFIRPDGAAEDLFVHQSQIQVDGY